MYRLTIILLENDFQSKKTKKQKQKEKARDTTYIVYNVIIPFFALKVNNISVKKGILLMKKGYESIARDMLQDEELSIGAIGLLSNIVSYADGWVLRKTELYTRFKKSGRTTIDRCWDELVDNGYIIQFRRREGKGYNYQYLASSTKFDKEKIMQIANKVKEKGFEFYHKAAKNFKALTLSEMLDILLNKNTETTDDSFTDQEQIDFREVLSECSDINVSSSVDNKQSNMSNTKRATKRFNIKRFSIKKSKKIEEEEYIKDQPKIKKHDTDELIALSERLLKMQIDCYHIDSILEYLRTKPSIDQNIIDQQLRWMDFKSKTDDGIGSFSQYFINGYKERSLSSNINHNSEPLPKVPMYNWLRGEVYETVES